MGLNNFHSDSRKVIISKEVKVTKPLNIQWKASPAILATTDSKAQRDAQGRYEYPNLPKEIRGYLIKACKFLKIG